MTAMKVDAGDVSERIIDAAIESDAAGVWSKAGAIFVRSAEVFVESAEPPTRFIPPLG
jgi:hypothetical protein